MSFLYATKCKEWGSSMNKKHRSFIIKIMAILVIGLMTYHVHFRAGNTIYIQSYDREYNFVLAEYPTERFIENIDTHFNESIFHVRDDEEFINEYVLTHPSYVKSYHYKRNNNEEYTIYYFVEEGYGFYLNQDQEGLYSLNPSTIQIFNEDIDVISQFIPTAYMEIDNHYTFESMSTIDFMSFEDYVEFYQQLSCICSEIDEENKIIKLRSYNYDDHLVESNYQIVLSFDDLGFIATIEEIQ